jgi:protein-S-isoprenylcysteine O-methyltransferase Ste14
MDRVAAAFSGDGGAIVYSAMDVRLLAGLDVSRGLFRCISRDHALSDEKRSAAFGATDERGPRGRETAGAKDHHVSYVAGIYRAACHPDAGSPLRVVSHAALGCTHWRCPGRAWLPRCFFRLQGKHFHLRDHRIGAGPKVISTGPYALVRHPMYAAGLVLLLAMPIALGSWWGVLVFVAILPALLWRLFDEEKFLAKNLQGYPEYQTRVRYRLIPHIW